VERMVFGAINLVVPGLIAEGLTLFAGKPKIGKSWLLLHAAWAVAAGDSTLGGIKVESGDVFYAALEDNRRRLSRRMTRLFGVEPWPPSLHFATVRHRQRYARINRRSRHHHAAVARSRRRGLGRQGSRCGRDHESRDVQPRSLHLVDHRRRRDGEALERARGDHESVWRGQRRAAEPAPDRGGDRDEASQRAPIDAEHEKRR